MRTLVYKRTHNGDPNELGVFGCNNCMGKVRAWDFKAVIGVGGQGGKAKRNKIARKLNWIGIGPHKTNSRFPDPIVTFDHFLYFGKEGEKLSSIAPALAKLMYVKRARNVMTFSPEEQADIDKLLAMAENARPSSALTTHQAVTKGKPCRRKRACPTARRRL